MGVNGWAVSVTDRRGTTGTAAGGLAVVEFGVPFGRTTVVNAASVMKQFVAIVALHAAARGRLDLDSKVEHWLPGVDPTGSATLRHCLHHVSGIRDAETLLSLAGMREYDFYTADDLLSLLRLQRDTIFPPGSRFSYSNSGYIVLTRVLEEVLADDLGSILRQRVFGPAGLDATAVMSRPDLVVADRAYAYRGDGDTLLRADRPSSVPGASGLLSSTDDLRHWLSRRAAVLASLGLGHEDLARALGGVEGFSRQLRYGAGLFVEELFDVAVAWLHHGGHEMGYSTQAMSSARGELIVCASNHEDYDGAHAAFLAARVLLREEGAADRALDEVASYFRSRPASSGPTVASGPAVDLTRWVGTYASPELPLPVRIAQSQTGVVLARGSAVDELRPVAGTHESFLGPGYRLDLEQADESTGGGIRITMPRAGTLRFAPIS